MDYRVIDSLDKNQIEELTLLFKNEWWTQKRKAADIEQMLQNSNVVIGLIDASTDKLVGFARAITDTIYRAFIFDVIAHSEHRELGIGKILMDHLLNHPLIKNVERVELYCPDRLTSYYEKFGFTTDVNGSNLMRRA
ncbi:GNAT family N-acetyltransferase [Fictibacillus barbaricus]|uniref:Ribosomal protein S18 acetylase RimI-like enzyme n=1 Tax=Fictibacillus barbaricus TaxID=182136 RepID=A0ABU1U211_9BACL|nr:GNAT family N-acetyltransferase [Fictibacillus barbaricus]MDR7073396.1 ribosomal protein S18 acetylase RimI-like enzyme [Fictibacillus barbaricus]